MADLIEKIHGGYRVDGLELMVGNRGRGGLCGDRGALLLGFKGPDIAFQFLILIPET